MAFENVEEIGKAVVEQWKEGRTYFHLMTKGFNAAWSDVKESILAVKEAEGLTDLPAFYTTSVNKGDNSFFTVEFDAE